MSAPILKLALKDGSARYRVVVDVGARPDGGRDQHTRTFRARKDATAWLSSTRAAVGTATYVKPARETLNDHLDSWPKSKRLAAERPATLQYYSDALRPMREHNGR